VKHVSVPLPGKGNTDIPLKGNKIDEFDVDYISKLPDTDNPNPNSGKSIKCPGLYYKDEYETGYRQIEVTHDIDNPFDPYQHDVQSREPNAGLRGLINKH
jgi:hypothetical protein